jgi:predicted nuclease of predicted toxin-antitoxin system
MRIKLDENLPASLAADLRESGHDVETVPGEGLKGRPDTDVWAAAQGEGRFLVTQDLDFSDIRRYSPGTHAGLLLVRLAKPGRSALRAAVL